MLHTITRLLQVFFLCEIIPQITKKCFLRSRYKYCKYVYKKKYATFTSFKYNSGFSVVCSIGTARYSVLLAVTTRSYFQLTTLPLPSVTPLPLPILSHYSIPLKILRRESEYSIHIVNPPSPQLSGTNGTLHKYHMVCLMVRVNGRVWYI